MFFALAFSPLFIVQGSCMNIRLLVASLSLVCITFTSPLLAEDWPQWMGVRRDGVWNETGTLDKFPAEGPKVLWRAKIAGGYAGPAVSQGRVVVTDFVTQGEFTNDPQTRNDLQGTERVLCLDAASGKELWKFEYPTTYKISYPCGPRCTPTIDGKLVYTLGAEGNLCCLELATGKLVWSRELKKDYSVGAPLWGFAGHPLVEGNQLICLVGGKGAVAVSFDKLTGKELWKVLDAREPGYAPPTIVTISGQRQLVIFHSESINGLAIDGGKTLWSVPVAADYGMSIMAPRSSGSLLYAAGIVDKGVMLKFDGNKPSELWRTENKLGIDSVCSTPIIVGETMYGVDREGELTGMKLETGEHLWQSYAATTGARRANSGTAFLVKNGEKFFLFNEKGELVIAKLSSEGYEELSRGKILEPTGDAFGRKVVWSHPAFANKTIIARNDQEIVCVSLAAE